MSDVHPDAPNPAVEAAARAIFDGRFKGHVWEEASEIERMAFRNIARAVIQALVDGGHYVPKADAERAWNAEFIVESTKRAEARLAEAVDLLRRTREKAAAAMRVLSEAPNSLYGRYDAHSGLHFLVGELDHFLAVFDNPVTGETEEQ